MGQTVRDCPRVFSCKVLIDAQEGPDEGRNPAIPKHKGDAAVPGDIPDRHYFNLHFNLPKSSIVHKRGTESKLQVHYDALNRNCKC